MNTQNIQNIVIFNERVEQTKRCNSVKSGCKVEKLKITFQVNYYFCVLLWMLAAKNMQYSLKWTIKDRTWFNSITKPSFGCWFFVGSFFVLKYPKSMSWLCSLKLKICLFYNNIKIKMLLILIDFYVIRDCIQKSVILKEINLPKTKWTAPHDDENAPLFQP